MSLGRTAMVWTGKHLVALVLIAIILAYGLLARDSVEGGARSQIENYRELPRKQAAYTDALKELDRTTADLGKERGSRQAEFAKEAGELKQMPANRLRERISAIEPAITEHKKARLSTGSFRWAILRGDTKMVSAHYRAGVEIGLLAREKKFISDLLAAQTKFEKERSRARTIEQRLQEERRELKSSYADWRAARTEAEKLRNPKAGDFRNYACSKYLLIQGPKALFR